MFVYKLRAILYRKPRLGLRKNINILHLPTRKQEENEVCERCKEYFDGLLNVNESGQAELTVRPGMNVKVF